MNPSQLAWIAIAVMIVYGLGRFAFSSIVYRRTKVASAAEARRLCPFRHGFCGRWYNSAAVPRGSGYSSFPRA